MQSLITCETWMALFYLTVACAVCVTALTAMAWRHRLPSEAWHRWLVDPSVLFRPLLYVNPRSAARTAAIVLLVLGVLLTLVVGIPPVVAVLKGDAGFCGGVF